MKQYNIMCWSNVFNHIRNFVIMKYHVAILETECKTIGAAIRLTDRESLVNEVEGQLKKLAITASNRKDHVFLSINTNRQGFISKENLRALVSHHHLPADSDIIDGVSHTLHTTPRPSGLKKDVIRVHTNDIFYYFSTSGYVSQ